MELLLRLLLPKIVARPRQHRAKLLDKLLGRAARRLGAAAAEAAGPVLPTRGLRRRRRGPRIRIIRPTFSIYL